MAAHPIARYAGMTVTLIYLDRRGTISQRRVRVDSVGDGKLKGYCLLRRGRRLFDLERILAFSPHRGSRQSHG